MTSTVSQGRAIFKTIIIAFSNAKFSWRLVVLSSSKLPNSGESVYWLDSEPFWWHHSNSNLYQKKTFVVTLMLDESISILQMIHRREDWRRLVDQDDQNESHHSLPSNLYRRCITDYCGTSSENKLDRLDNGIKSGFRQLKPKWSSNYERMGWKEVRIIISNVHSEVRRNRGHWIRLTSTSTQLVGL